MVHSKARKSHGIKELWGITAKQYKTPDLRIEKSKQLHIKRCLLCKRILPLFKLCTCKEAQKELNRLRGLWRKHA